MGEEERNRYVMDFKGFVTYVRNKGFLKYADQVRGFAKGGRREVPPPQVLRWNNTQKLSPPRIRHLHGHDSSYRAKYLVSGARAR